jgi:PAS domain S-box-containing protein
LSNGAPEEDRATAAFSAGGIFHRESPAPGGLAGIVSDARLRRLVDSNIMGILVSANDGAILEANDAFLEMVGYTRADLAAGAIDWRTLTPPEWLPLDERAIEELRDNDVFSPYEKEYVRKDGTRVPISLGGARIAGTTDQQICYIVDLSEVKRSQAALRRSELRFKRLTDANVIGVISSRVSDGTIVEANDEFLRMIGYTRAEFADRHLRWSELTPEEWHAAAAQAMSELRALGRFAPFEKEYLRRDGSRVPVLVGGALDEDDDLMVRYVLDLTEQKNATQTLRFIERAGSLLSRSLDLNTTLRTVLDLIVPVFGDWATVSLLDDDGRLVAGMGRHAEPALTNVLRELRGVDYLNGTYTSGSVAAVRSGQAQLIASVTEEYLQRAVKPPYQDRFRALGFGSFIALPIFGGESVIGVLTIVSRGERRIYTRADLPALEELARRAGFAIANARLYEHQRRVADVFQEAALPRSLPAVDGFRFDGYYQAGRQEALIGGDWYDAFLAPDGCVIVSVGDVSGSGLRAAVLMSSVRQVIRGATHVYRDPDEMLGLADRTLRSEHEDGLVTAFVAVIDPQTKIMRYASAGHLPPYLGLRDGSIVELRVDGLPLGCRDWGTGESQSITLPAGARLLLYTDGLVEWSRDILAGDDLLRRTFVEVCARNPSQPARTLVDSVLGNGDASDDIAVLVVSVND